MNKIFQKIWEEYKKCNVTRRLRMLEKYGFSSENSFKTYMGIKEASYSKKTTAPKKAASKKSVATKKATKKTAYKTK